MSIDDQHIADRWDPHAVPHDDDVASLVYRSNLLGADTRITNTGGGNTSLKSAEVDPLTGASVDVLWVKGSGGDLRTARRENFASLYLEKLLVLRQQYLAHPQRGAKTSAEDAMVDRYPHCTFNLNSRAASIDTPLHAFVPWRHVDHTHPNAVIALAAARRSESLTREVYGDEVAWTPWLRPGFELGLRLHELTQAAPGLKGIVLGQHGLINGAESSLQCYQRSLELIERAAQFVREHERGESTFGGAKHRALSVEIRRQLLFTLLPWLRGQLSQSQRVIATVESDDSVLEFVNSVDAGRLAERGTSCPDHFLRTKIKPLYVDWEPDPDDFRGLQRRIEEGLAQYRRDYAAYYQRCRRADSPDMRDPNPTVILIPGVGMVAWGKNKSESRVTAEFYHCAIQVIRGAEAMDEYVALPEQEAFDIEYWKLEEAKLRRMPAEKPMARQVVVVIGAGSGIGRAAGRRMAAAGAHVVCCDRDRSAAELTAADLAKQHGIGIGVAGTGISACGPIIALDLDITDRARIRSALADIVLAYGGIDHVIVTAGIYVPSDEHGRIPDQHWGLTFDVNVTGPYFVADEASAIWRAQGLHGSFVWTTSVNAVVAKTGSMAYDASKAAANHLVRELALELAPLVRVNGVAPATVLVGSGMFSRERVLASLAKYRVPCDDTESTDSLRDKLAQFYATRTLTKSAVLADDQAAAIAFLASDDSRCTTGQVLTVDGGLPDAFLR